MVNGLKSEKGNAQKALEDPGGELWGKKDRYDHWKS